MRIGKPQGSWNLLLAEKSDFHLTVGYTHYADTTDPTRVALLADTHISDDPSRSCPGTKWPGTPVKEDENEWVNMADSLAQSVREIIALKTRPANLIINGDCALSRGTKGEYQEFLRLIKPIREAGITVHITIGNHDNRENLWGFTPFPQEGTSGYSCRYH